MTVLKRCLSALLLVLLGAATTAPQANAGSEPSWRITLSEDRAFGNISMQPEGWVPLIHQSDPIGPLVTTALHPGAETPLLTLFQQRIVTPEGSSHSVCRLVVGLYGPDVPVLRYVSGASAFEVSGRNLPQWLRSLTHEGHAPVEKVLRQINQALSPSGPSRKPLITPKYRPGALGHKPRFSGAIAMAVATGQTDVSAPKKNWHECRAILLQELLHGDGTGISMARIVPKRGDPQKVVVHWGSHPAGLLSVKKIERDLPANHRIHPQVILNVYPQHLEPSARQQATRAPPPRGPRTRPRWR